VSILTLSKALSIDPLNSHTLDLLNLALEAIADGPPFRGKVPGGEEMWQKMMKEQAETAAKKKADEKDDKPTTPNPVEGTSTGGIQDVAMADA
jgi:anaphase-promoting complex subunit 6